MKHPITLFQHLAKTVNNYPAGLLTVPNQQLNGTAFLPVGTVFIK